MQDFLEKIIAELERIRKKQLFVIVEGKKDIAALDELGITNVKQLDKPVYAVCEDIAKITDEVVILTDLDAEGKKLYSKLNEGLSSLGVRIDNKLRDILFLYGKIDQIEGLANHLRRNSSFPE